MQPDAFAVSITGRRTSNEDAIGAHPELGLANARIAALGVGQLEQMGSTVVVALAQVADRNLRGPA